MLFVVMLVVQRSVVFDWSIGGFLGIRSPVLVAFGALDTVSINVEQQYWRLATATMLHGSVLHLLLNGLALWQIGRFLEDWYGGGVLIVLHVLMGSLANLVSYVCHADQPFVQIGSSGALFGLLAYLTFASLHGRSAWHGRIWRTAAFCLVVGLVLGSKIHADHVAHVAGAVIGCILGMFEFALRPKVLPRLLGQFAAAVAGIALAGCFYMQHAAAYDRYVAQQARGNATVAGLIHRQSQKELAEVLKRLALRYADLEERKQLAARLQKLDKSVTDPTLKSFLARTIETLLASPPLSEDQWQSEIQRLRTAYLRWQNPHRRQYVLSKPWRKKESQPTSKL